MKTKKGRTYEEVVALMKEGAKEERKKIEAARAATKSELLQIKVEPKLLEQIHTAAAARGVRYTTLVRDWITEKLEQSDQELAPQANRTAEAIEHMTANMQVLVNAFNHLAEKVNKLEAASPGLMGTSRQAIKPAAYKVAKQIQGARTVKESPARSKKTR